MSATNQPPSYDVQPPPPTTTTSSSINPDFINQAVGIIIPPTEIKIMIEKTAQFIAENGAEFELKLLQGKDSSKFNFIKVEHPYHAYYKHRIDQIFHEVELGELEQEHMEQQQQQQLDIDQQQPQQPLHEHDHDDHGQQQQQQQQQHLPQQKPQQQQNIISKKASVITSNTQGEKPKFDPLPFIFQPTIHQSNNNNNNNAINSTTTTTTTSTSLLSQAPPPSALQLDIINLTAQYAAANGKDFLQNVTLNQANHPLFQFLLPTHHLFQYFLQVSEVYSRIINPEIPIRSSSMIDDDNDNEENEENVDNERDDESLDQREERQKRRNETVIDQLKMFADKANKSQLLHLLYRKAEWETMKEEELRRRAMDEESEKSALNAIDWHDFVVVETIDFDPDEEIMVTTSEVNVEGKDEVVMENGGDVDDEDGGKNVFYGVEMLPETEDVDMEIDDVEMDTTDDAAANDYNVYGHEQGQEETVVEEKVQIGPSVQPSSSSSSTLSVRSRLMMEEDSDEEIEKRIRKNYDTSAATLATTMTSSFDASKFFRDPTTGELIPIEQAETHMRIKTLNPMWKEQKSREIEKFKTTNIATDAEISNQLSSMVKKRTGAVDQQTQQQQQNEQPEQPKPVRWDGHKASIALVSAQNAALGITMPDPQAPLPNLPMYGPSIPQQQQPPPSHQPPPPSMMMGYVPQSQQTLLPTMVPPPLPTHAAMTGPRPDIPQPAPKRQKVDEQQQQ